MSKKKKIVIIGAAGMDYHTFNTYFRDNEDYEVKAFTMAVEQNIGTTDNVELRKYPSELAGKLYPDGILTVPEKDLENFIKQNKIDQVVLAYSDLLYNDVMRKASRVLASGAEFKLIGPQQTMLKSNKPVIAVCAVRTGCGKSQTSRAVYKLIQEKGYRIVAVREPMPYGDLVEQACMRFATFEDLDKYKCTIEEREEYEPYIENNLVIYSGVDYARILAEAEKEADIILWDGGNNEVSFYKPDLLIVLADPHRPGHEISYYPGEVNARLADAIIIGKIDKTVKNETIEAVINNIKSINPEAQIIKAASKITVEEPDQVKGKKVLIVEDGPTLTHGGAAYGAGYLGVSEIDIKEIIDPRPFAIGSIKNVYQEFSHLTNVLPAMGYNNDQLRELEETINNSNAEVVVAGTPIDLKRIIKVNKPVVRVKYDYQDLGDPTLAQVINKFLDGLSAKQ